jgi:hypothetical protein
VSRARASGHEWTPSGHLVFRVFPTPDQNLGFGQSLRRDTVWHSVGCKKRFSYVNPSL